MLLVEDVITTGGAVLAAAAAVRGGGAKLHTVVCAIDRRVPDSPALLADEIQIHAVMTKGLLDGLGR